MAVLEQRLSDLENRIERKHTRITQVEQKVGNLEVGVAALTATIVTSSKHTMWGVTLMVSIIGTIIGIVFKVIG